jgi:hypothetical protein
VLRIEEKNIIKKIEKKINERQKVYKKERRKNNIKIKIKEILSSRLSSSLKTNKKSLSTMMLVGCDIDFLMYYLQKQFIEGMTWDNHGKGCNGKRMQEWHIDHIKPCASFDFSKPEEQRKCFHYTNLQPLWANDNWYKNKY